MFEGKSKVVKTRESESLEIEFEINYSCCYCNAGVQANFNGARGKYSICLIVKIDTGFVSRAAR
jgi:hypothetical protein